MVVNSTLFLFFFAVVFLIYYLPPINRSHKLQNLWLLLVSYIFYSYADIRMIPLLFAVTIIFFLLGKWLKTVVKKEEWDKASRITTLGVCIGIAVLLYFKYLNFFAESIAAVLSQIGLNVSWTTLNIVMPIGVSFFTFKLISYIIEINNEGIEPCKDFVEFALYISFFPTILSGPIDRPNTFLPQLRKKHQFNYPLAVDGCRQILWGMFTKMCIADNLAATTDLVWADHSSQSAGTLIVVALLYYIEMYADFDGYSNMAIGIGKLLGFNITRNFNHPFLARNMAEFWNRWHISLTKWITDYVYTPLNYTFRDKGKLGVIMAIMINLIVIGFWHGANWNYGLYGLYHGLLFVPLIVSGSFGKKGDLKTSIWGLPRVSDVLWMVCTFILVSIGLVLFRASSVEDASNYFWSICTLANGFKIGTMFTQIPAYIFTIVLVVLEWFKRQEEHPLQFNSPIMTNYALSRYCVYCLIMYLIVFYQGGSNSFIYFQF